MPKIDCSNITCSGTVFLKTVALVSSMSLAQTSLAADRDADNRTIFQEALNYFGFPAGPPDGVWGRKTHNAIRAFNTCLGQNKETELTPSSQSFFFGSIEKEEKYSFPNNPLLNQN